LSVLEQLRSYDGFFKDILHSNSEGTKNQYRSALKDFERYCSQEYSKSLDVIGIVENRMDFIEIKKKGARLSTSENKVRRIIEEKNIEYVVKDVEIPTGITVEERELPKLRQRN